MEKNINLIIKPDNINIKTQKGENLLKVLKENNIDVESACNGIIKCGKCKIKIINGKTKEITKLENKLLSSKEIKENIALACNRNIEENLTIEVKVREEYKVSKTFSENNHNKIANPIVKKIHHKLTKPSLQDQASHVKRITREYDKSISINSKLIPNLHKILEESNYEITRTIFDNEIIKIEQGDTTNKNFAIAIDIGTTTVAGYLINLNNSKIISNYACSNMQKKYGADVISRINYAIEKDENLKELKKLVIESIETVIENLLNKGYIKNNDINIVSIIGNTTMSHLLLGADVRCIAKAPFVPIFDNLLKENIDFLGIKNLLDNTPFILLPNIGSYVGSDTLGVIISTDLINKKGNWLAIDIGTNCELVLKTDNDILTCSTAAGPTFEGANMDSGMRAELGAIYTCEIDDDIKIKTIGDVDPKGICGSGYIDIISKLIDLGVINKKGRIKDINKLNNLSNKIKERIVASEKGFKVILDKKNDISITQEDVSNLQLAKGAIRAGIDIMLQKSNIDNLDGVLLCGCFGSNLNIDSIKNIKMLPNICILNLESVGNAAGKGAIEVLIYQDIYESLEELQNKIKHLELVTNKDFQDIFIKSIMF